MKRSRTGSSSGADSTDPKSSRASSGASPVTRSSGRRASVSVGSRIANTNAIASACGQAHQKAIRPCAVAQAERHAQRLALRRRQPIQPIEHRRAQLVQGRERKLLLRLQPPARATRTPSARSHRSSSSAVLPTPGSPRITSTPPRRSSFPQSTMRLDPDEFELRPI